MTETLVQGSHYGGVLIAQEENIIHLSDADIARLIQVRFCFERMNWNDLISALTLWEKLSGVKQVPYEQVMLQGKEG